MPSPSKRRRPEKEIGTLHDTEDVPQMVLRPRKIRVLSPPTLAKPRAKRETKKEGKAVQVFLDGIDESSIVKLAVASVAAPKEAVYDDTNGDKGEEVHGKDLKAMNADAHSESEDEDAGPETVSLSASHAQSLKRAAKESHAAQTQDAKAKQKRRQRDTMLKVQAEERAKKAKPDKDRDEIGDVKDGQSDPHILGAKNSETTIKSSQTDLLPQYLLDHFPAHRSPSPPAGITLEPKGSKPRPKKPSSPKQPQDLVLNPRLTVSVLNHRANNTLPPAITHTGQVTRANWLLGRAYQIQSDVGQRKQREQTRLKMIRKPWGDNVRFS